MKREYGELPVSIQSLPRLLATLTLLVCFAAAPAMAETLRIVALGDSLIAGPGLQADQTFSARLEAALQVRGHDVVIVDAGVSGDTTRDGLARLDWSIDADADAVIIELGANDALRGTDPTFTRAALEAILDRLSERKLPVLLAGMIAPPNLGDEYAAVFNPIFGDLAAKWDPVFYPFFLDGVAGDPRFNLKDGMHPNAAGVDIIVKHILPASEALIARIDEVR